jgi:Cu+-exporting ATPase
MNVHTTIPVSGMTCGHCEGRVVKGLRAVAGVTDARASAAQGRADVTHEASVPLADLIAAVTAAGYEAGAGHVSTDEGGEPDPEPESSPPPGVEPPADAPSVAADVRLNLGGMSCASCVASIQGTLASLPGVQTASVNLLLTRADVAYDPLLTDPQTLIHAVTELGYSATLAPREQTLTRPPPPPMDRREPWRVAWTLAVGVVTMLLGMPLMNAHNDPAMRLLHPVDEALRGVLPALYALHPNVLRWILALLASTVIFGTGRKTFVLAWLALRRRTADMHVLVALGTGVAYLASLAVTIAPEWLEARGLPTQGWFDAVPWVLGLTALGRWLEERAKRRTTEALDKLVALQPATARVVRDGQDVDVAIADVLAGDVVRVRPGEAVPVDGVVTAGESALDVAMLTGESMPVVVQPGARVFGGTRNTDGALTVRALAVGEKSALARIVRMVEDAQTSRPDVQRLADRVASIFVPIVLILAALTVMLWMVLASQQPFAHGLSAAIAVLVIACPCAMGLAVPTTVMVAIGRAAQLGVLVRSGAALERGHRVTALVLDKTGTLTLGQPAVVAWQATPDAPPELADWLVAAQKQSEHPLAQAIVRWRPGREENVVNIAAIQSVAGKGVKWQIATQTLRAGRPEWLQAEGVDVAPVAAWLQQADADGLSVVVVAVAERAVAVVTLADPLRPTSQAAIARLSQMGLEIWIASGDRRAAVAQLAKAVNLPEARVLGQALPEDKLALIQRLQAQGHVVAMVGDGVNDAPALAAADVGMAMGQGADVATAAADLALVRGDLNAAADALLLSRAAVRNIRQNLGWAFGYNLLGIPLAAGALFPWTGWLLSPAFASLAMAFSSVSVVLNALRLRRFTPKLSGV